MLRAVATIIAGIGLHGIKVQQGVAAHQPLQLCGAEQVNGRTSTKHHETSCKRLKLHHTTLVSNTVPHCTVRDIPCYTSQSSILPDQVPMTLSQGALLFKDAPTYKQELTAQLLL